jgi:hypothetical protein
VRPTPTVKDIDELIASLKALQRKLAAAEQRAQCTRCHALTLVDERCVGGVDFEQRSHSCLGFGVGRDISTPASTTTSDCFIASA